MTARHDQDTTDADLVAAAASGDRTAFAAIYDRYANRLHDFCVGMLRDRDAAADCVQDAFCTAATKLTQLRDADKLRPWLYSIARNEALRHERERRREEPTDMLPELVTTEAGPETLAARSELADLVAAAAGGLSERDQTILDLTYRHELDGLELAEVLGVSQSNAGTLVHRLRDTVERSLGALLVARRVHSAPDTCLELAADLDDWDGEFTVLTRNGWPATSSRAPGATRCTAECSPLQHFSAVRRCSSLRRHGCASTLSPRPRGSCPRHRRPDRLAHRHPQGVRRAAAMRPHRHPGDAIGRWLERSWWDSSSGQA
jgi:RNA polymerase sigma factor (sigma-70 family)